MTRTLAFFVLSRQIVSVIGIWALKPPYLFARGNNTKLTSHINMDYEYITTTQPTRAVRQTRQSVIVSHPGLDEKVSIPKR